MKLTAQDFIDLTAKIEMNLRAAQAQMTQLRAWIASLDLPDTPHEFSQARFFAFVRNTAHVYTDQALLEEFEQQGGPPELRGLVIEVAGAVRDQNEQQNENAA